MAETSKSKERRLQEGFYDKYIKGYGIDIGVGRIDTFDGADPIALENCVHHDKENNPVTDEEIKEWEKKHGKLPKPPQEVLDRIWEKIKERINNNKK